MNRVTLEQLLHIMPLAGRRAELYQLPLNDSMMEFGIDTASRQAAFLANVAHESGQLRYTEEIASGMAYNERADLGNTRPEAIRIAKMHGTFPGPFWRGHGLIQITGYDNHVECGRALGLDLIHHPTAIAMLPMQAARSAAWFWQRHDLNDWADKGDFDGVCDLINRGRKTARSGDANGFADRLSFYTRAKEVLL